MRITSNFRKLKINKTGTVLLRLSESKSVEGEQFANLWHFCLGLAFFICNCAEANTSCVKTYFFPCDHIDLQLSENI